MPAIDIDLIGVPTFVLDVRKDGTMRFAAMNKAVVAVTGLPASAMIGRTAFECLPPEIAGPVDANYRNCVAKRALHEYDEQLGVSSLRWWRTTLKPTIDQATGAVVKIVGVSTDITERKELEEQLGIVAHTDPLTGIANRRRLHMDVQDAMAEVVYTGRLFGIVLIDLDRFKLINDTYGHQKGDEVLRHVASLLNLMTRRSETVARIGGDEFAMLLQASSETDLASKVEALRRFLDRSMSIADVEVKVGASLGAALWTGKQTFEDLLAVADREMYRQKGMRREAA
ncbi:MAG: GGDEF domain-containing protein [Oxalobacteraceae bacterium]|nr:MAG: GGDEF domain-containing protein [Oxalobacteraceae bacterium]